jgi:hypothetical protein
VTTKLEKELKREIMIDGEPYTITISPVGLKLSAKGRRKGQELEWKDMVTGQSGSSQGSNASLEEIRQQ